MPMIDQESFLVVLRQILGLLVRLIVSPLQASAS